MKNNSRENIIIKSIKRKTKKHIPTRNTSNIISATRGKAKTLNQGRMLNYYLRNLLESPDQCKNPAFTSSFFSPQNRLTPTLSVSPIVSDRTNVSSIVFLSTGNESLYFFHRQQYKLPLWWSSDKIYLILTGSLRHTWPKPELKALQIMTKHVSWRTQNIPKDPIVLKEN